MPLWYMPLSTLVYATFHPGFPFWYMPLSILVYATFHFCLCHFPFWYMPLSILVVYATFRSGICHFPFWDMPLSILVYATFHFGMSIICLSYVWISSPSSNSLRTSSRERSHKVRSWSPSSFTHVVTRGMPLCDSGCHTAATTVYPNIYLSYDRYIPG